MDSSIKDLLKYRFQTSFWLPRPETEYSPFQLNLSCQQIIFMLCISNAPSWPGAYWRLNCERASVDCCINAVSSICFSIFWGFLKDNQTF